MMKSVQKLRINKEYLNKIPRPNAEQYDALKESIKEKGQLEPITVNENYEIIDGYTRFQICNELKLEPRFQIRKFEDKHQESLFVRTVNQKRRHLNAFQIYEIYEDEIEEIKQQNIQERNEKNSKARKGEIQKNTPRSKYENTTQYKVSKLTGISGSVYENIVYLKANADSKTLEKVRQNKLSVNQASSVLRRTLKVRSDKGRHYRTRLGIAYDILSAIVSSNRPSSNKISFGSRLEYSKTTTFLKILSNSGFVTYEFSRGKEYSLTKKGEQFYQSLKILENQLPIEFLDVCV